MRHIKPYYYDDFLCAAGNCPDTCCAGWQIMIDEETLKRYWEEKGSFGSRLANSVDWEEGCFLQYQGKCTFLDEQNLCELVTERGEAYLCQTCHRYPRHVEEFEDLREWSLSLSCPIAARMILECRTPVRLLMEEDGRPDPLAEEFDDFDLLLFTKLEDAREIIFSMIFDKSRPVERRMEQILLFTEKLQSCLEQDRLYEMDDVIREAVCKTPETKLLSEEISSLEKHRFSCFKKAFAVFFQMEHLRDEWSLLLEEIRETLYVGSYESYQKIREEFLEQYKADAAQYRKREQFQENLLWFFLYTYFCGAVYDDWIYSKTALAVFSVCFVQEFVMCKWYLSDKRIEDSQWVELAYRYAREVEHSDDNLNVLEEWLMQAGSEMKGMVAI